MEASAAVPTTYWCHMCQRTVTIPHSGTADLVCPLCNCGFIEETAPAPAGADRSSVVFGGEPGRDTRWTGDAAVTSEGDDGIAVLRFVRGAQAPPFVQMLQTMSAILQQDRQDEAGGHLQEAAGLVDPIALVQNMFGGRAGNVEVFLDNGTGNARRLTGNIGDYYFGQGLDQLIQQLAENDPNRYGTPPASKSAIDAMPTISITSEHMGTDAAHCAVCKDEFEVGMQVRQMPCKHLYHGECILPWLTQHNSCPVCRFELPTDDPDYDRNKNSTNNENTSSSSSSPGSTARGFSVWDSAEASPAASTGATAAASATTTTTTAAAAAAAAASPSMGRRGSFHFPWPFGRSSSSSPASPQQGQQQSDARRRSGNDSQAPSSSSNDAMRPDVLD